MPRPKIATLTETVLFVVVLFIVSVSVEARIRRIRALCTKWSAVGRQAPSGGIPIWTSSLQSNTPPWDIFIVRIICRPAQQEFIFITSMMRSMYVCACAYECVCVGQEVERLWCPREKLSRKSLLP